MGLGGVVVVLLLAQTARGGPERDPVSSRAQLAAGLERMLRDVEARLDDGDDAGAGS